MIIGYTDAAKKKRKNNLIYSISLVDMRCERVCNNGHNIFGSCGVTGDVYGLVNFNLHNGEEPLILIFVYLMGRRLQRVSFKKNKKKKTTHVQLVRSV